MQRLAKLAMATTVALVAAAGTAAAQVKELRIGYQPSPIQDASIAMFETWGAKNGVKIVKVPNSYGVYVEKMTASLTSNADQYDVIWHNDDWGQTWAHLLEPTDDVDANKFAAKWSMAPVVFANAQGQNTVVPMGQTFSVFFYRSDIVKPEEVPKTLEQLVTFSKKLQADNKIKFGYVGGMSMNHSWFSWFWSMWGNNCDVLMPAYERDNKKLAANGWKSGLTEPCMQQTVEYWWDAINTHKIAPRGMPAYDRNEANAIFMAGDAAFTVADSLWWGTFNDPAKSKVAGKVAAARFPLGPNRDQAVRLGRHLGLGDPEIDRAGAQEARQADAGSDDARRGRPDQDVQGDRRAAAQHHVLAEDRGGGSVHGAVEGGGAGFPRQGARRLLLPAMARRAQGVQRHRHQGRHRQARGHRQGAGRRRSAGQQGRAIVEKHEARRGCRGGLFLDRQRGSVDGG